MKGIVIISLIMLAGFGSVYGQDKSQKGKIPQTNPKTDVKVNKEYDEDGNLIRYDSTYSYFYSGEAGDSLWGDDIIKEFRNHFNQRYFFSEDPFFKEFFFQDTLGSFDFYRNDFFENRFRFDRGSFDQLFRDMDSLKNFYFRDYFKDSLDLKER